jgi:hypothetical protein
MIRSEGRAQCVQPVDPCNTVPPAFSLRFTRAKRRSTGAAPGSIMPTIMTHHMKNIMSA